MDVRDGSHRCCGISRWRQHHAFWPVLLLHSETKYAKCCNIHSFPCIAIEPPVAVFALLRRTPHTVIYVCTKNHKFHYYS